MLHKYKCELPLPKPDLLWFANRDQTNSAKLVFLKLKVLVKSSTSIDFTLEWPAALQNFACHARDALYNKKITVFISSCTY